MSPVGEESAASWSARHEEVAGIVRRFLVDAFLPGERPAALELDLDLLENGILDSLAVLETASFVEELTGQRVGAHELTPDRIGSVRALTRFVLARRESPIR